MIRANVDKEESRYRQIKKIVYIDKEDRMIRANVDKEDSRYRQNKEDSLYR